MIKRFFMLLVMFAILIAFVVVKQPQQEKPIDGRFIKVDKNGDAISSWAGPWACVYDHENGLLWEVKTDSETIHDGYWSYSWFDGEVGEPNMGDCYFEKDRCDVLDLIKRTNKEALCGISSWRLPTKQELLSLVEKDVQPDAPMIAKAFFPQTKRGDYWTSEKGEPLRGTYRYLKEGAVAVNFLDGKAYTLPYRNAGFLRLVTSEYPMLKP